MSMTSLQDFLAKQKTQTTETLINDLENKSSYSNDFLGGRQWKPTFDKQKKAIQYVIRFLPSKDGSNGLAKLYKHYFDMGNKMIYSEFCPTSINGKCPVCEDNRSIWNSNQDLARKRGRKQTFISNILVIDDPENPDNNGKVFLYEMPVSVMSFIEKALNPQFPTDPSFNPMNIHDGANFIMKIVMDKNYWKYDPSHFDNQSSLLNNSSIDIEDVFNQLYDIDAVFKEIKFKPYEELEERFNFVMGETKNTSKNKNSSNSISTTQSSNKAYTIEESDDEDENEDNLSEEGLLDDINALLKDSEIFS